MKRALRTLIIIGVLVSNVGCDQVSKSIVRQRVQPYEAITIIKNVTLTKIENSGAFLSLGQSLPDVVKMILLIFLPVVVLGVALGFLIFKKDLPVMFSVGLAFIIGGGIGNIYDRVLYGSVTDFFHIDFVLFQTGIFNMADVSVMTGMFMIIFHMFFRKSQDTIEVNAE